MFEIINSNTVELLLLAGFVLLLRIGDVFDKRTQRLLYASVPVILTLIIVDIGDSYFATLDTLNNLRYLTSALGYTLRPVAFGLFITILLRKQDSVLHVWIPVIFIGVISLTTYWTHIMFYFTEDNVFERGPLGYLAHILAFSYIIALIYYTIVRRKVTDSGEIFAVCYIIFTCAISVILETFVSMKFLLTGSITSSAIVYYTYLYVQVYKTDPLTKVYNRTSFDKDVEKKLNRALDIINIDLDDLKTLNDTNGHREGDNALSTLADILLEEAGSDYRVYRVGGDEFYVIGYSRPDLSSTKFIARVQRKLAKTKYSASFGKAQYKPGEDFADCCIIADQDMYHNKNKKKNCAC